MVAKFTVRPVRLSLAGATEYFTQLGNMGHILPDLAALDNPW